MWQGNFQLPGVRISNLLFLFKVKWKGWLIALATAAYIWHRYHPNTDNTQTSYDLVSKKQNIFVCSHVKLQQSSSFAVSWHVLLFVLTKTGALPCALTLVFSFITIASRNVSEEREAQKDALLLIHFCVIISLDWHFGICPGNSVTLLNPIQLIPNKVVCMLMRTKDTFMCLWFSAASSKVYYKDHL